MLTSDKKRERLLREAGILTAALENSQDSTAPSAAFRRISHERLEGEVSDARVIATRRSGARGAKARKILVKLEEDLRTSELT